MAQPIIATHRVRSYELDSFGHVNNATYLNYLEYARGEYLLQRGLSFSDFDRWNAAPIVISAQIQFKSPAKVHDILEIEGRIVEWKRASFSLHYKVTNKTSTKLTALAQMTFAFVDQDGKLVPIPEEFRKAMQ